MEWITDRHAEMGLLMEAYWFSKKKSYFKILDLPVTVENLTSFLCPPHPHPLALHFMAT